MTRNMVVVVAKNGKITQFQVGYIYYTGFNQNKVFGDKFEEKGLEI